MNPFKSTERTGITDEFDEWCRFIQASIGLGYE